jgi:hypothetical protein
MEIYITLQQYYTSTKKLNFSKYKTPTLFSNPIADHLFKINQLDTDHPVALNVHELQIACKIWTQPLQHLLHLQRIICILVNLLHPFMYPANTAKTINRSAAAGTRKTPTARPATNISISTTYWKDFQISTLSGLWWQSKYEDNL